MSLFISCSSRLEMMRDGWREEVGMTLLKIHTLSRSLSARRRRRTTKQLRLSYLAPNQRHYHLLRRPRLL